MEGGGCKKFGPLTIKQSSSCVQLVMVSGSARSRAAGIKVSSIPSCKRRGVNSPQDDRCLQSAGYSSFLCRFSPQSAPPSGIAAVPLQR